MNIEMFVSAKDDISNKTHKKRVIILSIRSIAKRFAFR